MSVISMLSDFRVETIEEAILKAEQFLNRTIKEGWAVDDVLEKHFNRNI